MFGQRYSTDGSTWRTCSVASSTPSRRRARHPDETNASRSASPAGPPALGRTPGPRPPAATASPGARRPRHRGRARSERLAGRRRALLVGDGGADRRHDEHHHQQHRSDGHRAGTGRPLDRPRRGPAAGPRRERQRPGQQEVNLDPDHQRRSEGHEEQALSTAARAHGPGAEQPRRRRRRAAPPRRGRSTS